MMRDPLVTQNKDIEKNIINVTQKMVAFYLNHEISTKHVPHPMQSRCNCVTVPYQNRLSEKQ